MLKVTLHRGDSTEYRTSTVYSKPTLTQLQDIRIEIRKSLYTGEYTLL
jgi:hypothetical protein